MNPRFGILPAMVIVLAGHVNADPEGMLATRYTPDEHTLHL